MTEYLANIMILYNDYYRHAGTWERFIIIPLDHRGGMSSMPSTTSGEDASANSEATQPRRRRRRQRGRRMLFGSSKRCSALERHGPEPSSVFGHVAIRSAHGSYLSKNVEHHDAVNDDVSNAVSSDPVYSFDGRRRRIGISQRFRAIWIDPAHSDQWGTYSARQQGQHVHSADKEEFARRRAVRERGRDRDRERAAECARRARLARPQKSPTVRDPVARKQLEEVKALVESGHVKQEVYAKLVLQHAETLEVAEEVTMSSAGGGLGKQLLRRSNHDTASARHFSMLRFSTTSASTQEGAVRSGRRQLMADAFVQTPVFDGLDAFGLPSAFPPKYDELEGITTFRHAGFKCASEVGGGVHNDCADQLMLHSHFASFAKCHPIAVAVAPEPFCRVFAEPQTVWPNTIRLTFHAKSACDAPPPTPPQDDAGDVVAGSAATGDDAAEFDARTHLSTPMTTPMSRDISFASGDGTPDTSVPSTHSRAQRAASSMAIASDVFGVSGGGLLGALANAASKPFIWVRECFVSFHL